MNSGRRLKMEFVEPTYSTLGKIGVALSIILFGIVIDRALTVTSELAAVRAETRSLTAVNQIETSRKPSDDPKAEASRIAQATAQAQLAYSWDQIFDPIEAAATTPGVALLGLEHDQRSKSIRLEVEAADLPATLAYLQRLAETSGATTSWSISTFQNKTGVQPATVNTVLIGKDRVPDPTSKSPMVSGGNGKPKILTPQS